MKETAEFYEPDDPAINAVLEQTRSEAMERLKKADEFIVFTLRLEHQDVEIVDATRENNILPWSRVLQGHITRMSDV